MVNATVENSLVVSTLVVDLLDVIVMGFNSSFERCWEVVSPQHFHLHILMLDPLMSSKFGENTLDVDVVASPRFNS